MRLGRGGEREGLITVSARARQDEYPRFDPDFVPPPCKQNDYVDRFCRFTNASFERVTMQWVKEKVTLRSASTVSRDLAEAGLFSEAALKVLTTPPESPGVPRGVSLTILGSVPTALGWYGYYKFSVEEARRGERGAGEGDHSSTLVRMPMRTCSTRVHELTSYSAMLLNACVRISSISHQVMKHAS